ncbi:YlxR family protein [Enemella sp. A6]|uniref:YlxR family protein n=1 Tax=Enemella sp. A6 TaxID=3440152 RepID=UPI003EB78A40
MTIGQRTCVGCRRVDDRAVLVRLVWDESAGRVVVDPAKALPGRGAWVHDEATCVETACRRRAVGRALRRSEVNHDRIRLDPAFGFNNDGETR